MLYVKVVQNGQLPEKPGMGLTNRMVGPRRLRYQQDYSSLQVDSDQYDKVKKQGFSLSVKAEAQFSRTNQFKQSYTISSRQGQRPQPHFFNKQTIDYSQNRWMDPSSTTSYGQTPQQQQQYFMNMQKQRQQSTDSMEPKTVMSTKKWLDQSIDSKKNIARQQQGPFTSLNLSNRNLPQEPQGDHITQQMAVSRQYMEDGDFKMAIQVLQQIENEPDARFLLAYSLLQMKQFEQAAQIFEALLTSNPLYRKESYLFVAVAYSQMKKFDKSNRWLETCLKQHPNYYEAHLQLAQNCYVQQEYQASINHIMKAIKIDSENVQSYMLKADCLIQQKKYTLACDQYSQLEKQFPAMKNNFRFRIKQILAMIKSNKLDAANNNLNQVLIEHPQNGEALFLKGLAQFKKEQFNESLLTFEQVLHTTCPRKIAAKSLYYMGKVRINQKDFYAAMHNILRFDFYKQPAFVFLSNLKLFIEGTIQLMKRHFREAIEHYKNLLKHQGLSKFLRPIFYLYKTYGHFCLSEYQQVLDDYKLMNEMGLTLNTGALYNKEICEGLLAAKKFNYDSAFEKIDRAIKYIPDKMDPYLYKACLIVQRGCQNYSEQQRRKIVLDAQAELTLAFNAKGKSANFFYIRALIKSYFHRFTSAIKDLDKAIDMSEDNVVEHFYLRGVLQAQQMRLKQAVKDFSTCLHFNKEHADSYLERAKCQQITGDQEKVRIVSTSKAFLDLKKYIQLNSKDVRVHYWAGSLLFHNNAYDEALRAYSECHQTKEIQILLVKCNLKLQDLDQAYECLCTMVKSHQDPKVKIDFELVGVIRRTIELKKTKPKVENGVKDTSNLIATNLDILEKMSQLTKLNPQSFGYLFNMQDYYLHRAIVYFFAKNYTKCLNDFGILERFWMEKKDTRNNQSQSSQIVNTEESEQVQNEMILKSERIIQHIIAVKYNMVLTYYMLQQYKEAWQQCNGIKGLIGDVQSEEINYLAETATAMIDGRSTNRFPRTMVFLMNESSVFNLYPTVRIALRQGLQIVSSYLHHQQDCKLSISLPDIQPPNICPTFNEKMIETINPSLVENKPEAPWVKRENQTLIFTDNVFYIGDVEVQSEEEDEGQKSKRSRRKEKKTNQDEKEQMKQALKLDDKIQNKLNKILNSPKQTDLG